jgi:hypothetical protein
LASGASKSSIQKHLASGASKSSIQKHLASGTLRSQTQTIQMHVKKGIISPCECISQFYFKLHAIALKMQEFFLKIENIDTS